MPEQKLPAGEVDQTEGRKRRPSLTLSASRVAVFSANDVLHMASFRRVKRGGRICAPRWTYPCKRHAQILRAQKPRAKDDTVQDAVSMELL